jgi:hypothetical protein
MFLKNSLTALLAAIVAVLLISFIWKKEDIRLYAALGLFCAWVLSSASSFLLERVSSSIKKFFKVWLGGIIARVIVLACLMILSWRWQISSQAALLLSYCFGVLAFVSIESRSFYPKAAR